MTSRLKSLSELIALLFISSGTVYAQLQPEAQTGSRIPVKPTTVDPVLAGAIQKGFGRCIFRSMKDVSHSLMLHSDPLGVDWNAVGIKSGKFGSLKSVQKCLGDEITADQLALGMKFNDVTLRAILMEEAYLVRFSAAPSLPEGANEKTGRVFVSTGQDLLSAKGIGQFADCLVFNDTADADALLRTDPNTKLELEAARALGPALGACLIQGQTLSLTPTNIRAIVADGLWTRYVWPSEPSIALVK